MTPPSVPLRPLVSWPHLAEPGRSYLVTVDVEIAGSDPVPEWPYDQEEFAIGCMLAGCPGIEIEALGPTAVVLHRFGGTYGPARFVAHVAAEPLPSASDAEAEEPGLQLTLVTAGGIPFRTINLPVGIDRNAGGPGTEEPPTVLLPPREQRSAGPGAAARPLTPRASEPRTRTWREPRRRQVVAVAPTGSSAVASGYEIAPRLVLTLLPDGAGYGTVMRVFRPGRPGTLHGTAVWIGTGAGSEGLALLRIEDHEADSVPEAASVRWGRLVTDSVATDAEAVGVLYLVPIGGPAADVVHLAGVLLSAGSVRGGRAFMVYGNASPEWREGTGPSWPGVAGSAVFCNGLFTGVIVSHSPRTGPLRRGARVPPAG
ncbi:hypothetical protein [Kitasatospora sp. NPDC057500]|uniref:hypothetical protein n=1 Tax=Kitasatospora sp. NPDC057500 TaxID=3346151 RepID=UPI0036996835